MDADTLTAIVGGSGGTAVLGALAFGARKAATVLTSRMRKRIEAEHAKKMAELERERDEARAKLERDREDAASYREQAAHEREREELEATSEFQKTEALIASVHGFGRRLDRAEERLDRCEAEKRDCHEALDAERLARRSDIDAAKAECVEQIRAVRGEMTSAVRTEVRKSISDPHGLRAVREDGEG